MKSRSIFYAIISIIIIVSFFGYLVFGTVPPNDPNEQNIKNGYTNWSLDTEPIIYGKTIWSDFSNNINDTIKVYSCTYTGGFFHSFDFMSWETEPGVFSSESLDLSDLLAKWENSTALFKFMFEDDFYKVSFSIPKLENGLDKYNSLEEAWEVEELYQIVEKW